MGSLGQVAAGTHTRVSASITRRTSRSISGKTDSVTFSLLGRLNPASRYHGMLPWVGNGDIPGVVGFDCLSLRDVAPRGVEVIVSRCT
jgi:hypothetical protein